MHNEEHTNVRFLSRIHENKHHNKPNIYHICSMENLEEFVNDFLDGKLEPYLKSEAVPKSNDGPVKVGFCLSH